LIDDQYPISRDALYEKFKDQGVFARRYFYPLISNFPMYRGLPSAAPTNLPNATYAAERVLCLPIYPALDSQAQSRVIEILQKEAQ
jgi:dTDP-4-amino-4,6-dideoxygalactose transaminase